MTQVYILLPFVQFTICLVLISVVILSAPRDRLNRLFALFLLAIGLWGLTIFWMRDAYSLYGTDPAVATARALAAEKVVFAVIPFSSIIFYHFVYVFARVPRSGAVLYGFYGLGLLSAASSLLGWSVTGMVEKFYGFAPDLGWAFPLILLAAYPPVFLGIYDLTKAIARAPSAKEQSQLKLLRLGAFASVLGGTSDYIPSLGLNIYPMGVLGNITFGVLATWAVTRHRMMELRLALRRGLAHVVISSILFAAYGMVFVFVWLFAREWSVTAIVIASVGTIFIVGVFVQPVLGLVVVPITFVYTVG